MAAPGPDSPDTSRRGRAAGGQAPPLQVGGAVEGVAQLAGQRVPRDGVEREVAPRQILINGMRELDDGVAAERLDIAPERRDLVHHTVGGDHADGAQG